MTFGSQVDFDNSLIMTDLYLETGNNELDTAFIYNEGNSEIIAGKLKAKRKSISLATKVHPKITGKLDKESIVSQLHTSLNRMNTTSIDILYFHFPDSIIPDEEALKTITELYKQKKIMEFGLSNYPAWLVVDLWHICTKNGWLPPTVYQGRYNALSRNVEKELLPALKRLGIRFYAYNPLAGGLLSGKHQAFDETPTSGRFALKATYRNRYWKKTLIDSVKNLAAACKQEHITLAEAAFRWLSHHSSLTSEKNDGIILGASNPTQLEQNIVALTKGPLSRAIVDAFNLAWREAQAESPEYFQFVTPSVT